MSQGKRIRRNSALIPQPHFDPLSASLLPKREKGSQKSLIFKHQSSSLRLGRCPEFAEGDLGRGAKEYAFALGYVQFALNP